MDEVHAESLAVFLRQMSHVMRHFVQSGLLLAPIETILPVLFELLQAIALDAKVTLVRGLLERLGRNVTSFELVMKLLQAFIGQMHSERLNAGHVVVGMEKRAVATRSHHHRSVAGPTARALQAAAERALQRLIG